MAGVRLVINMHTKPGCAADYVTAWNPHYDEVNAEPGCLQYELFQSTRHPDHLALLELWQDRAAFDVHWGIERERVPAGIELLGHPRDRAVGRDGLEVYWEAAPHRVDPATGAWVRR